MNQPRPEAIYKEHDALYIIWPLLFLQGQKPPPSGWFWAPQCTDLNFVKWERRGCGRMFLGINVGVYFGICRTAHVDERWGVIVTGEHRFSGTVE